MSDSGSESIGEYDLHLSSLTVDQFVQTVEQNGGHMILLKMVGRTRMINIWRAGWPLNRNQPMEEFLLDAVTAFNNQQRASHTRPTTPIFDRGSVALEVDLEGDVFVTATKRIEQK
ncbi:hypothetical protein Mgra_00007127 [Meloidogyne graminicola]|uniref:Uncharacterized protein n=1 Tax=Meloidogyne graminicola TaxID=189291 RepID=A0A8S9ZJC4_9BILA|nr:hypothetical protein Mgra_00007127 [Meloidogyne graminicola]